LQEQSSTIESSTNGIKRICLNDGGAFDHDLKVCPFCSSKLVEVDKHTWLDTPDHDTVLVCPKDAMAYNDLGLKNCRFCGTLLVPFDEFNSSMPTPEAKQTPPVAEDARDATSTSSDHESLVNKAAKVSKWLKIPYGKLAKTHLAFRK